MLTNLAWDLIRITERVFFSLLSFAVVYVAFYEPDSLLFKIVQNGGWSGALFMFCLFVASSIALIDVIVNDCLPEKYRFCFGCAHRRAVWVVIAAIYASHAWVITREGIGLGVALIYVFYSAKIACTLMIEAIIQYKEIQAFARAAPGP